jgi:hypothetical protein
MKKWLVNVNFSPEIIGMFSGFMFESLCARMWKNTP